MARGFLVAALLVLAAACARKAPRDGAADGGSVHEGPRAEASALVCGTLQGCTDACSDGDCAARCALRLTPAARPFYEALQACVKPACADADAGAAACRVPNSFGCKMCVLAHCAAQASRCMAN
ncbi:MAG TPA: hypothetical protein VGL86_24820 [Polyangia bacterium]|jgi:hypothetical protein